MTLSTIPALDLAAVTGGAGQFLRTPLPSSVGPLGRAVSGTVEALTGLSSRMHPNRQWISFGP